MSLLRRGGRRTKVSKVLFTAVAIGAFQVLAIVGAGVAQAATCTYNPATDTINITIGANEFAAVAVETATADLDTESSPGAILFDNNGLGFEDGGNSTACGSATNTTTVAIVVLGQPNADETFNIDEFSGAPFNTAIAWNVDMGGNTVGGTDTFDVDLNNDQDNTIVVTNSSFDLNGAVGELLGTEFLQMDGADGDDVIDLSGASLPSDSNGGNGDDTLFPGTNVGDDHQHGDAGEDTLSYATRTTCTVIEANNGIAGIDLNCDGDIADAGEDADDIFDNEIYITGSGNDTITGDSGVDETFEPGDGDDDVTGNAADDDVLDQSSATGALVIDPDLGTSTGQGNDTFTDITGFVGGAGDDTLVWDGTTTLFQGGDGTDVVDASAMTTGQDIDLDDLDGAPSTGTGAPADSTENAKGGSANDHLDGNDLNNRLEGNDGDDQLDGFGGNDFLIGSAGNDSYSGGDGADKVSFKNSPNGVDADVLLGFATGEGSDSLSADIEILVGSQFNDSFTGGGGSTASNFRLIGNKGNDILTGSGSNDTLKGGGGKDTLRGSGGDDTLLGAAGNDKLFGGNGDDVGKGGDGKDVCKGVEIKSSCGKQGNPARGLPHAAAAAKLARLG